MRILSFVEGADSRKGGLGLVGVPWIANSLAERGHQVVLNLAGSPNPGTEHWVQPDVPTALAREAGLGHFGIVTYPCLARCWAFSPTMFKTLLPYVRDADFITLHSLYSFPVLTGYLLARWFRKPYGLWPHGVLVPFQRTVGGRKKKTYDRVFGRRILDEATVLFFSSIGEREEAAPLHLRAPSVVIPDGTDVDKFAHLTPKSNFRAKYLGGYAGPLVLYLGRLNAKKGLDLLINSVVQVTKQVCDLRLAIIGSSDPPLEAMACGVPVVTSNVAPLPEVVGDAGLMCAPDDYTGLAQAMYTVLTNGDIRQALIERGLMRAKQFTWERTAQKTFAGLCASR